MKVVIMFGPPGSGKGTQAALLAKKLNFVHLSTGEVLRKEIAEGTELGKKVGELIRVGSLVSDEIVIEIVKNFLNLNKDKKGFVFDGFPRTYNQAKLLNNLFFEFGIENIKVINLVVDKTEVIKRLLCRAQIENRTDDNVESITNRLNIYEQATRPVLEYYCCSASVFDINGVGDLSEIHTDIVGALSEY